MKKTMLILTLLSLILIIFVFLMPKNEFIATTNGKMEDELKNIIELKFAHNISEDSALHDSAVEFAKRIKEKSNGRVKIKIFPEQQLGNDHQMVEMARNGEIDILLTPTAKMSVVIPSMQYVDLPFLFPSREDIYMMLDGEPGKMLLDKLKEINLIGVTFWENGFKHFTANKALLSPKDFKNMKFRVMKSRIIMEQFKHLGAEPIAIDFYSTKKALADGVVDGQENPLIAIVSMGFHEVQSNLILSSHAYLGYLFSISYKTFEKLPVNISSLLIETAREITPLERKKTMEREKELLKVIKEAGVKINEINESERREFASLTTHIAKEYEDIIGVDIISKTEELFYKKYGDINNSIVIGLNADLSMSGKGAGLSIKRGAELAISEINAKGGILGKKIVLIAKDHKATTTQGIENLKEFIDMSNIVGIIGGKHSAVIAKEMELISKHKIPYIVPWAAASKITENLTENDSIFRVSINDTFATKFLASYTMKSYKKPIIVVENSIWGRSALEKIKDNLMKFGVVEPKGILINRGQNDFNKEIGVIKNSRVDSIIIVLNTGEGSRFVNYLGKNSLKLPIVSHWGIIGGKFFENNNEYLKELDLSFIQTFSFINQKREVAKNLAKEYLKSYNKSSIEEIASPIGVAQTYDAVNLLISAIKEANSTDFFKIKEALENLKSYEGAIKTYAPAFTSKSHDALDSGDFFMAKFNKDGSIIRVENSNE